MCVCSGSSAGAGSEVFHVYRHLRRRENDRQDYISSKAEEEKLEEEFQQTVAVHRAEDDARTAKKRAKRSVLTLISVQLFLQSHDCRAMTAG